MCPIESIRGIFSNKTRIHALTCPNLNPELGLIVSDNDDRELMPCSGTFTAYWGVEPLCSSLWRRAAVDICKLDVFLSFAMNRVPGVAKNIPFGDFRRREGIWRRRHPTVGV